MRFFVTVESDLPLHPGLPPTRIVTQETVYMTERVEMASMLCAQINKSRTPGLKAWLEAEL